MKLWSKLTLINVLCCVVCSASADDGVDSYNQQMTANNTQLLAEYLKNLGGFLGYNLTNKPDETNPVSPQLLDKTSTQAFETVTWTTYFGTLAAATPESGSAFQLLSSNAPGASLINSWVNLVFNQQSYSSPAKGNPTVSVNALIDQQSYQADPVSQTLLNILGTPDNSFCIDANGNPLPSNATVQNSCNLYKSQVLSNVLGTIPQPYQFFSYVYNQPFLGQLNSNSLMSPLFFTTDSSGSSDTSSPTSSTSSPQFTALNQAQQAENFIRYASGSISPPSLPTYNDYQTQYMKATNKINSASKIHAQGVLSSYFTNLRIYAAQSSVGLGNMYYILSKRLPQTPAGGNNPTSQGMNEFNLATWRLYRPSNGSDNKPQWIDGINSASAATVQKEIAVLLAEINYQMYLDRQIQERILLTNSVMLMQNTKASQPTANFNGENDMNGNANINQ